MKIATTNNLAHYQCEMIEINEQYRVLSTQLGTLNTELAQTQQYLSVNNGDAFQRKRYRDIIRQRSSIVTQINKLQRRYMSLQRRVGVEQRKIMFGR